MNHKNAMHSNRFIQMIYTIRDEGKVSRYSWAETQLVNSFGFNIYHSV